MMVALRWLKWEQGQITRAIIRPSSQPRVNSADNVPGGTGDLGRWVKGAGGMLVHLIDALSLLCVFVCVYLSPTQTSAPASQRLANYIPPVAEETFV